MANENGGRMVSAESSDTFGNYLIHGIDEIILPDAVSWWPSAPGWQVLGVLASLFVIYQSYRRVKRWWRDRYRREALRQLAQAQQQAGERLQDIVIKLPYFIKVTALQAYPREDVASLSGNEWLNFLDAHYTGPSFSNGIGKKLLSVAYLPQQRWQINDAECNTLINMSRQWITKHE